MGGGILAAIYTPRIINTINGDASTSKTSILEPTLTETSIPSSTSTQTATPETPTPEVWNLSLSQRIDIMKNSNLFTDLQANNTKKIITLQFDENEYTRLKRENNYHNNTCGVATLATIKKMFTFLNTGKVPDTTIADIDILLDGKFFTNKFDQQIEYINSNELMPVDGFPSAINLLMPELISKVEYFTPAPFWSSEAKQLLLAPIPLEDWNFYLSKAQDVCKNGGCAMIVGLKHNWGHVLVATDVKEDYTAMIADSYDGTVKKVSLNNYFEYFDKKPGLFAIIGITPKTS